MKFQLTRYPSNENPKPILEARQDVDWEAAAVFNPSVVVDNGKFIMLYRTYSKETKEKDLKPSRPGAYLAHQVSYIGYAESKDGITFERRNQPFISPSEEFDMYGCEDPRITKIEDIFYITYTAIDAPLDDKTKKPYVRIALATTKDFITITKHGIIGPPKTSKASAFFPEKVNGGKIALAMTVSSDSTKSHIAIRYFDSIEEVLEKSQEKWEAFLKTSGEEAMVKTYAWLDRGPELGAPPILTDKGWLMIFSAEAMTHTWAITCALFDRNEPHKMIGRAVGNILQPTRDYELQGLVPNVTFPEGAVIVGEKLYVYYGCADTRIGLATCNLHDLLEYLEGCK